MFSALDALEDRPFKVSSVHKTPVYALHSAFKSRSPCEICHLDFALQLAVDIRHVSAADSSAADTLSHADQFRLSRTLSIDLDATVQAQLMDSDIDRLEHDDYINVAVVLITASQITVICCVLQDRSRSVVSRISILSQVSYLTQPHPPECDCFG